MFGVAAGFITAGLGIVVLVASFVVNYNVIPNVIYTLVRQNTVLIADTEQWERFEVTPFPLTFSVYFFNITNPEEVLNGGVPVLNELKPYYYKLYTKRLIENVTDDTVRYRRQEFLEFDAEASFPRTEQDEVTIANPAYLAILQAAESSFPSLMPALNLATANVFGNEKNSPISTFKVEELLLKGSMLCVQPGLIGGIACNQIRNLGAGSKNMEINDDGTILFSLIRYKNEVVSDVYEAKRGLDDLADLGLLTNYAGQTHLQYWPETAGGPIPTTGGSGPCNKINGTDAYIFGPFLSKEKNLFALNLDICRSVELFHLRDTTYSGIQAYEFATNELFLANEEGCFCLDQTKGITRLDGCLLKGAAELVSCTGGPLVLSSPHFLYADEVYQRGVIGLSPDEEKHRISLQIEPYTGTPLKAAKRAQFNAFLRPIEGITATGQLLTTLTPIFWIEEALELPDEYVEMLKDQLVSNLELINILIPLLFAVASVVTFAGLIMIGWYIFTKKKNGITTGNPIPTLNTATPDDKALNNKK